MSEIDILFFSAVRRQSMPKSKLKYMITKDMIRLMPENGILCDATACNYDLIETSKSSELLDYLEKIEGIWHWSPDHIPAICPYSSSKILSDINFNYLQIILERGIKDALKDSEPLRAGVQCINKKFVHKITCEKKGFELHNIFDLIEEL